MNAKILERLALPLLCALMLAGTGCETDPASGFQIDCLELANNDVPINGEISLVWGANSTCDFLDLELYISDVEDIWSVSFTLDYPGELAQLIAVSSGDSLLREDGNDLIVQFEDQFEDGQSSVVASITRTNSDLNEGVDAPMFDPNDKNSPPPSLVIRLTFLRLVPNGSGPLEFGNTVVEQVPMPGMLPVDANPPIVFNGDEFEIN